MKEFIKKLQSKPEPVKKHILHITTGVLAIIIFLFWINTLTSRLSSVEAAPLDKNLKPLGIIKENIANTYNGISGSIKNIKKNN